MREDIRWSNVLLVGNVKGTAHPRAMRVFYMFTEKVFDDAEVARVPELCSEWRICTCGINISPVRELYSNTLHVTVGHETVLEHKVAPF